MCGSGNLTMPPFVHCGFQFPPSLAKADIGEGINITGLVIGELVNAHQAETRYRIEALEQSVAKPCSLHVLMTELMGRWPPGDMQPARWTQ